MRMRKIMMVVAAAASVYGVWQWRASDAPKDSDRTIVRDRFWIDHLPRNERETVKTFALMSKNAAGVFNDTSMWRGSYELFRYEMNGDEIRMEFPQTGDRDRVRARAWRCNERGMDFCLELSGSSRGTKRYYSREGWELRSLDDARAELDAIEAQAGSTSSRGE